MTAPSLTLAQINQMTASDFSQAFGRVFEHSGWIAERAFTARPFATVDDLHGAMRSAVLAASEVEQLALLRAHPALAGREAQSGTLTAESAGEQAGAGLNALSSAEMARVAQLNAAYATRFGHPFIIAVRLNNKETIFSEFERRLAQDAATEQRACLDQVFLITSLRLRDLVAQSAASA